MNRTYDAQELTIYQNKRIVELEADNAHLRAEIDILTKQLGERGMILAQLRAALEAIEETAKNRWLANGARQVILDECEQALAATIPAGETE